MSILRVRKGQHPYVTLDTTALNDPRLSFRAKGLHTYLMSKPDHWQVYIRQLEQVSPTEGRQAITMALKELERAGYIFRERLRGEKGRMKGWKTTIFETSAMANLADSLEESPSTTHHFTDDGLNDKKTTAQMSNMADLLEESPSTTNHFTEIGPTEVGQTATSKYYLKKGLNGIKDSSHKNGSSCGTANGVAEPHPLVDVPEVATPPMKKQPRAITPLDETDWLWRELQHYGEEFALDALNDDAWWSNVANSFPLFAQEWVAPALADLAQWLQQNPQRVPRSPRGWKQRVSYSLNRAYDIYQRRQHYGKATRRY